MTNRLKNFSPFVALVITTLLLFTACTNDSAAPAASEPASTESAQPENTAEAQTEEKTEEPASGEKDDTFIYAIGGDPGAFVNSITTGDRWGHTLQRALYNQTYSVLVDGSIEYYLATNIELIEDGKVLRMSLRDDVYWHDGEKFDADDVVFTYTKLADASTGSTSAARLTFDGTPVEAVKVDDYTVDLVMPYPNPAAEDIFANFMLPEHIYKDTQDFENSPLHANPVGTGPYMLKEYMPGEYVHLEANPNYYKGEPHIKNVILRVVENTNSGKLALQKGEVDAIIALPSDLVDFEGNDNLTVHPYSEGRVGYMMLNTAPEIMKNKNVRKAIFYALDRDELNKAVYLDEKYYDNAYTFLPPSNKFYYDGAEKYEQNVEKAKELLAEEGIENLTLTLAYIATDAATSTQAILIQQYLNEVGITLELKAVDSAALTPLIRDPEEEGHHMFLNGYIMGSDPSRYQGQWQEGNRSNFHHYVSREIEDLFAAGAVETDPEKRVEIYNELQALIMEEAIIFPIVDNMKIIVTRSDLAGLDEAKLVSIYTFGDMSQLYYE